MRRVMAMLGIAIAGFAASSARAADEDAEPDLDFLEYLGSWQGGDEEWVIAEGWEDDAGADPDGRPAPEPENGEDAE